MTSIIRKLVLISLELLRGLQATAHAGRAVTIFGSARFQPGNRYYDQALRLAQCLAQEGITIITGGGPGIMEAGNLGAFKTKKRLSIGCPIQLPFEESGNQWTGKKAHFQRFFIRKFVMTRSSEAFVVFPGGYGTLDELSEVLTLIQCRKQEKPVKVILFGSEYWKGLLDWFRLTLCKEGTIDREDLDLFTVTDSIEEAAQAILEANEQPAHAAGQPA